MVTGATKTRVAANMHIGFDDGAMLVSAVVIGSDAARAIVHAFSNGGVAQDRPSDSPLAPSAMVEFLISTKLPTCAHQHRVAHLGASGHKGPINVNLCPLSHLALHRRCG